MAPTAPTAPAAPAAPAVPAVPAVLPRSVLRTSYLRAYRAELKSCALTLLEKHVRMQKKDDDDYANLLAQRDQARANALAATKRAEEAEKKLRERFSGRMPCSR